jgi:hypothetical protein
MHYHCHKQIHINHFIFNFRSILSTFNSSLYLIIWFQFNCMIKFNHSWKKFVKREPRKDWLKPLPDQISARFRPSPVSIILSPNRKFYASFCVFRFCNNFIFFLFLSEMAGMNKSDSGNRLSEVTSILICLLLIEVCVEWFRFERRSFRKFELNCVYVVNTVRC